jgi:hypothetical protein
MICTKLRSIFAHETAFTAEYGGLGDELSIEIRAKVKHLLQLFIGSRVEGSSCSTSKYLEFAIENV